jgi:hypothetical protein
VLLFRFKMRKVTHTYCCYCTHILGRVVLKVSRLARIYRVWLAFTRYPVQITAEAPAVLRFFMVFSVLDKYSNGTLKYESRLQSSWTGSSAPLLCRGRRYSHVMPSCSGGGNVVVA